MVMLDEVKQLYSALDSVLTDSSSHLAVIIGLLFGF